MTNQILIFSLLIWQELNQQLFVLIRILRIKLQDISQNFPFSWFKSLTLYLPQTVYIVTAKYKDTDGLLRPMPQTYVGVCVGWVYRYIFAGYFGLSKIVISVGKFTCTCTHLHKHVRAYVCVYMIDKCGGLICHQCLSVLLFSTFTLMRFLWLWRVVLWTEQLDSNLLGYTYFVSDNLLWIV